MELADTGFSRYTPRFNPETGKYEDRCPIEPRERLTHTCLCGSKPFSTPSEFKAHIARKAHQIFVLNYIEYIRDTEDLKRHVLHLQAHFELSLRKYQQENHYLKEALAREREINCARQMDSMSMD